VLALDAAKKPLLSFVPGKSVTAVGIANENAPAAIAAPLPAPSTGPSSPISALRSASLPDSVKLSFVVAAGTGSVLVYRGLAPFADAGSLLDAVLIATIPDGVKEFVDYPVPGQSYYYALVSEAALKAGKIEFKAGANATQNPATIATTALYGALPETGDLARITPLPSNLFGSQNDRNTPPRAAALAADTEKAISAILAPFPPPRPLPPALTVLVEDKAQAKGGEDYALSLIIQGPLKREDYAAAIDQLQRYLSLNRSKAVASRAHFYLGQAYAKSGSYRDAFFEFLQARDLHASESRPWILYVIAVLRS
jgi:tetratricopeptide (TPR) repeat protein